MSPTAPTADADQWASFCDNVKAAGMEILAAGLNADPVNKSEGLRYLTRILRGALEMYVEYSDPIDPALFKRTNERLKYGFDNPDNIYSTCTISDRHEYEIRGNRGSVSYLSINLSNSDTTGIWCCSRNTRALSSERQLLLTRENSRTTRPSI